MKTLRIVGLFIVVAVLAGVPWFGSDVLVQFGINALLLAVLAQGWNIIGGYTGYASFGNSVFYGLGSYGVAIAMVQWQLPFGVGLAFGAIMAVSFAVLLGLPVLDNVAVGALFGHGSHHIKLSVAREQARACLDFVGLGKDVEQRADALGGPGRKRLELAKALAMRPRLLLCDEVMSGLNLVEINDLIDVIRKVRDQGISILVIEHVIKAIKSPSDRLLVLHHGEKIAEGAPDTVLSDPIVIQAYLGKKRA